MLESTVWRQYNEENNYGYYLSLVTNISLGDIIEDEKALYAALKSKLTKKELKLFSMESGNIDDEIIKNEFNFSDEELKLAKYKLHKKFKQDKTRLSFRA